MIRSLTLRDRVRYRDRVASLAVTARSGFLTGLPAALGTGMRFVPGLLGSVFVSVGIGLAYLPAGIVVAGLFLLALDRRID